MVLQACQCAAPHPTQLFIALPKRSSPPAQCSVLQQRQVGELVLLEATLENATKASMLLDTVTLLPSPPWAAERIGGGGASALPSPVTAAAAGTAAGAAADPDAGPLRCAGR